MNVRESNLSANSMRHLLTRHGRSTTPGLLQSEEVVDTLLPVMRTYAESNTYTPTKGHCLIPKKIDEEVVGVDAAAEKLTKGQLQDVDIEIVKGLNDLVSKEAVQNSINNPPIALIEDPGNKKEVSFTFHPRIFKNLKGDIAREAALREMGSVDTLINRYGYVGPKERKLWCGLTSSQHELEPQNGRYMEQNKTIWKRSSRTIS